MNEQFIDEVMGLVARLEGAVEFGNHEQIVWERGAIRAKLREVVRVPLGPYGLKKIMLKLDAEYKLWNHGDLVQAVEEHHGIIYKQGAK